jgi:hypothetical protein
MTSADKATRCNAVLSSVGPDHVTITVLFEKQTAEALGWSQYGVYPRTWSRSDPHVLDRKLEQIGSGLLLVEGETVPRQLI